MPIHRACVRALLAGAALALAGCGGSSPTASGDASAGASPGALDLTGSRIIGCCCGSPCPCRINHRPMHSHGCDYITAVKIDRGHINGVPMDGVDWVVVGRTFGDPDGNWVHVYVSNTATDAQIDALKGFFRDETEALGDKAPYLIGQDLGMRTVPIQWSVSEDGRRWDTTIPGILDIQTRALVLPGHDEPVRSTGIFDAFGDSFTHADTLVHTFNDPQIGYSWDLAGRQCNQAEFRLTSERVAKGGIGWGCWSAHADLDDGTEYQEHLIGHQ